MRSSPSTAKADHSIDDCSHIDRGAAAEPSHDFDSSHDHEFAQHGTNHGHASPHDSAEVDPSVQDSAYVRHATSSPRGVMHAGIQ